MITLTDREAGAMARLIKSRLSLRDYTHDLECQIAGMWGEIVQARAREELEALTSAYTKLGNGDKTSEEQP